MVTEQTDHIQPLNLRGDLALSSTQFLSEHPFPHVIIDGFLEEEIAILSARTFPTYSAGWNSYVHYNERKYGLNDRSRIPASLNGVIDQLYHPQFIRQLEALTGLSGLIPDPTLAGAGLHQMERAGYLNIHTDFLQHPYERTLHRKVNLILFLTPDWNPEDGGELEFWDKTMTHCIKRISPKFNRCVIFKTDKYSYHGCPNPIQGNKFRNSIALYYYTRDGSMSIQGKSTRYHARPSDSRRKWLILLDNFVLSMYSHLRTTFGVKDSTISRLLSFFHRKPRW